MNRNSIINKLHEDFSWTMNIFKEPNEVFEVRLLKTRYNTVSGFFTANDNGINHLVSQLEKYELLECTVYFTINKVRYQGDGNDLNKLTLYAKETTKDADIEWLNWLHVDLDPHRKTGTQATIEEREFARVKMMEIKEFLDSEYFSTPVISFSGNGYNLDYYIDFENTKENVNVIRKVLRILSEKFSDDNVEVDVTTFNASRIIKLFGCKSAKGDNTTERPHSWSKILDYPEDLRDTPLECLNVFISKYDKGIAPTINDTPFNLSSVTSVSNTESLVVKIRDVEKWLKFHGIVYKTKPFTDGVDGIIYVLDECPFNPEHRGGCCSIMQFKDRNVQFRCFHNHCSECTIHDFIKKYPLDCVIPFFEGGKTVDYLLNDVIDNSTLFLDQEKNKYIQYRIWDKVFTVPLFDESSYNCISEIAVNISKQTVKKRIIEEVMGTLSALYSKYAIHTTVANRIHYYNQALYYALSPGDVIKISADGIESYSDNDILFLSSPSSKVQVRPDLTAKASDLPTLAKSVFNINSEFMLLFLANLVAFFFPHINVPILTLIGLSGSAKSTVASFIKELVDPTDSDKVALADNLDNLIAYLSSSYLAILDNVDTIPKKISDILCITITKGYYTKRTLFTTNALTKIKLGCHIIITAVNDPVKMKDLSERCNINYLDKLYSPEPEEEFPLKFQAITPKLLGSIFDVIRIVLGKVGDVKIKNSPRMADFAKYGVAIIDAIGLPSDRFLEQYTGFLSEKMTDCNQSDPLITTLIALLKSTPDNKIDNSSEEILNLLQKTARMNFTELDYTPSTLSRRLGQLEPELKRLGVIFIKSKSKSRSIHLELTASEDDVSTQTEIISFN